MCCEVLGANALMRPSRLRSWQSLTQPQPGCLGKSSACGLTPKREVRNLSIVLASLAVMDTP